MDMTKPTAILLILLMTLGQDVKQWRYDISSWADMTGSSSNNLHYEGLFNGQEYTPSDGVGNGNRNIHAEIWIVYYQ